MIFLQTRDWPWFNCTDRNVCVARFVFFPLLNFFFFFYSYLVYAFITARLSFDPAIIDTVVCWLPWWVACANALQTHIALQYKKILKKNWSPSCVRLYLYLFHKYNSVYNGNDVINQRQYAICDKHDSIAKSRFFFTSLTCKAIWKKCVSFVQKNERREDFL